MAKGKRQTKEKSVDKVHEELESVKGMLARALADYDNLNKRVEREKADFSKIASLGIIIRLLPILDNLESAQAHLKDQGLAISIGEFKRLLNEEGLVEVKPQIGEEFDENTMEAIEVVGEESDNSGSGKAKVVEVALTGWKFSDGKVVRHAKVKVSKSSSGAERKDSIK
jgi:molecular chaperone GrpE